MRNLLSTQKNPGSEEPGLRFGAKSLVTPSSFAAMQLQEAE